MHAEGGFASLEVRSAIRRSAQQISDASLDAAPIPGNSPLPASALRLNSGSGCRQEELAAMGPVTAFMSPFSMTALCNSFNESK